MTWEYEYHENSNETAIYWEGVERTRISGRINRWKDGYPMTDAAREAVAEVIQEVGTPERIRMQFDFNYGFSKRESEFD